MYTLPQPNLLVELRITGYYVHVVDLDLLINLVQEWSRNSLERLHSKEICSVFIIIIDSRSNVTMVLK